MKVTVWGQQIPLPQQFGLSMPSTSSRLPAALDAEGLSPSAFGLKASALVPESFQGATLENSWQTDEGGTLL